MKTLYYNGVVYTGTLPLVDAFVVEHDKVCFVGSHAEALPLLAPEDAQVDLQGHFVCAGFNDSHMHLLGYGNMLHAARLGPHTQSLGDMLTCLKEHLEHHPVTPGNWLFGRGWNHDYFTDVSRMPTREDLDQVSTQVPICAVRACGHCLVINSKGLELLGLGPNPQSCPGGRIGVDAQGAPNGLFFDNAMDLVYDIIPVPDKEHLKDLIRSACRALNQQGVTSVQSDDYCLFRQVPWQVVNQAYQELEASGELTVRVYEQCNFTTLPELKTFVEQGNHTGVGSPWFKIGPLKLLGDGALGARTAYLSRPYADDPSTQGLAVFSQETMDALVEYAHTHRMQIAIHAIGDACLDLVLSAYEKALLAHPRTDHRHGVVHCQISRTDQLERIVQLGLHVYCQSIFLDYDNHIVEPRVGSELAQTSYCWKTLLSGGAWVSNGSDCPVELPNVMAGIQCAVTRTTLDGSVGPYLPQEAFTVEEALNSYTHWGAHASFEEHLKGQLKPGMLADFVVLSDNPFQVPPHQLSSISVLATYVGGLRVYQQKPPL